MQTYHIHIKGIVQGVGFRPFVYKLAKNMQLNGSVNNTTDGVHVFVSTNEKKAIAFYNALIANKPMNAVITEHFMENVPFVFFDNFSIVESTNESKPDLLLTPDIAICSECLNDIVDEKNKREDYPFTTCLNCGPRYSIVESLPYDRENTTMQDLQMCNDCKEEYNNVENRRHYSQTNSCKNCAIQMHLFSNAENEIQLSQSEMIDEVISFLQQEKIVAVKGIGGYLLLCDATNENAIATLRERKHRPAKPLAIMYTNVEMAEQDVEIRDIEKKELQSKVAPIVLCKAKDELESGLSKNQIAGSLDKIGVMLPYAPLLLLLSQKINKPLVATSGNVSGSPILYKDNQAKEYLFDIADYVLTYDREIVTPQDDSVVQFSATEKKIILRRSRGLSPNYFPNPFQLKDEIILATGGELKSAFAVADEKHLYISQFLGNQESLESQLSYQKAYQHLSNLVQLKPTRVLVDKHPSYYVNQLGSSFAKEMNLDEPIFIQHHYAHFAAVLAENNLLFSNEKILGIIWDGTGYGDDKQIWGGEFFCLENNAMERVAHLKYFPQLMGDKMSKEPRLSALSLFQNSEGRENVLKGKFTDSEWNFYHKSLQQNQSISTSSMGRFLDTVASLLGIKDLNSFEGEAAMNLEACARNNQFFNHEYYPFNLIENIVDYDAMLDELLMDLKNGFGKEYIAYKVFYSLAKLIESVSDKMQCNKLAFSGGVFQNALLVDMIVDLLSSKRELYFHQQLSPNDECISFGQIAYYQLKKQNLNF